MPILSFDPDVERYVSLATFRRNGAEVLTPVWIAQSGERFYVFSEGTAPKVKRLQANPKAKLASCEFRGNLKSPWVEVCGRIVNDDNIKNAAYRALRKKYGWQMAMLDFFSGLSGNKSKRALIELRLEEKNSENQNSYST